jgi:hypothetical protein
MNVGIDMKFLDFFKKSKGADMPEADSQETIEQLNVVFHEKDII